MNDYLDPTKNFTPRQSIKSEGSIQPVAAVMVDHTNDLAVMDLAKRKLVRALEGADTPRDIASLCEKILDRIEGKPMVRTQNLNVNTEKRVTESDEAILARFGLKIP